jgi:hypothetical protein
MQTRMATVKWGDPSSFLTTPRNFPALALADPRTLFQQVHLLRHHHLTDQPKPSSSCTFLNYRTKISCARGVFNSGNRR